MPGQWPLKIPYRTDKRRVYFVALTAGRQPDFTALAWPSTLYAAELPAWDVFLGLFPVYDF